MASSRGKIDKKLFEEKIAQLRKALENEVPPSTDEDSEKEFGKFWDENQIDNLDDWLKHKRFLIEQANENSERQLRRENAKKAYGFSWKWAVFIVLIVIFKGFNLFDFKMTESEYLATIGVLTITVFTYYTLVLKYLFYRKPTKEA